MERFFLGLKMERVWRRDYANREARRDGRLPADVLQPETPELGAGQYEPSRVWKD